MNIFYFCNFLIIDIVDEGKEVISIKVGDRVSYFVDKVLIFGTKFFEILFFFRQFIINKFILELAKMASASNISLLTP